MLNKGGADMRHAGAFIAGVGLIAGAAFAVEGARVAPLPEKVVVLTFDDAVSSQYTFVAPLLKKYGFGATFFVCEFPSSAQDKANYLNWEQIAELNKLGFEIGNHTRTHAHIGKISDEKIVEELNFIDEKCRDGGISKTTTFAYPGYGMNAKALPIFQERGFQFARAGGNRCYDPAKDHPYLVPSFDIAGTNELKGIGFLKQAAPGKIVVLTFHGVPDLIHPWVNTPPELFKSYMRFLKENRYTVIAMRDLARYADSGKAIETLGSEWKKRFRDK